MTATPEPTVLVMIDDLFFLSKVQATLGHLGWSARVVTSPQGVLDCLQAITPALVVIDLTLRAAEAVACIQAIRRWRPAAALPILAFAPHVAVELQQQALQAGADRVVARSEFSQHLPDLLRQYALRHTEQGR